MLDPAELGAAFGEELSVEERARRERTREKAGGIVAYAVDRNARIAALVLSGKLLVADLVAGGARELDVPAPVFDPRPDPSGRYVAFVHARALHVVRLADGEVTRLAGEDEETVSWGVAEFVAAEEMERNRGYWWAPDGEALLSARVDEAPVSQLWITDAADPGSRPRAVRYPRAGSANAAVDAYVVRLERRRRDSGRVGARGIPVFGRRALGRARADAGRPVSGSTAGCGPCRRSAERGDVDVEHPVR